VRGDILGYDPRNGFAVGVRKGLGFRRLVLAARRETEARGDGQSDGRRSVGHVIAESFGAVSDTRQAGLLCTIRPVDTRRTVTAEPRESITNAGVPVSGLGRARQQVEGLRGGPLGRA